MKRRFNPYKIHALTVKQFRGVALPATGSVLTDAYVGASSGASSYVMGELRQLPGATVLERETVEGDVFAHAEDNGGKVRAVGTSLLALVDTSGQEYDADTWV